MGFLYYHFFFYIFETGWGYLSLSFYIVGKYESHIYLPIIYIHVLCQIFPVLAMVMKLACKHLYQLLILHVLRCGSISIDLNVGFYYLHTWGNRLVGFYFFLHCFKFGPSFCFKLCYIDCFF